MFLLLVCVGCMISSASILVLSHDQGSRESLDSACSSLPWLYSLGFVITFATLFARIWRVQKIFNNKSLKRMHLRDSSLFGRILIVVVADILLLVTWATGYPISWTRTVLTRDVYEYPLTSVGHCSGQNYWTFWGIVFGFHITLLLYGNALAYSARNIPTRFQEGKFIGLCLLTYFQVMAISLPILIMVNDQPEPAFFTRVCVVFINDFAVMGFIFLPKVHAMHQKTPDNLPGMGKSANISSGTGGTVQANIRIDQDPVHTSISESGEVHFGKSECMEQDHASSKQQKHVLPMH